MDREKETSFNSKKCAYAEHQHILAGWRLKAFIFTITLSIFGYFLFSLWGGFEQVFLTLSTLNILTVACSLSIAMASYLFRFIRWNYFLHLLGYRLPRLKSLQIYLTGFSLTTTPGKAGEALRSVFLNDYGLAYRTSFAALFTERLSDLIALVLLASGGLLTDSENRLLLLFPALFIILVLYTVQQDHWLKAIENWTSKRLHERFAHNVELTIESILAFKSYFTTPVLIYGSILGSIAWGLEGTLLYYVLETLGINISLMTCIYIHAFALLLGALSLIPAGLGIAEVTMFQLLLFNGVPAASAVTATLFVRLSTLWFSVLLGLIALPKKQIKLR